MDSATTYDQELRVPIIQLDGVFIVVIQVALDDNVVLRLKEDVARTLHRIGGKGLIIDLSGIDVVDSYISRTLYDIAAIARLMGVQTVLCGLAPNIAMTLVQMGLEMQNVETARDLDSAHRLLLRKCAADSIDEDALARSVAEQLDPGDTGWPAARSPTDKARN